MTNILDGVECEHCYGTYIKHEDGCVLHQINSLKAQLAALTEALETKDRVLEHRAKKIDQLLELVRFERGWAEIDGMTAKALGACPPHAWSRDGETCTKCGDKDWM